ncbi:MAG: DegV family protein [Oscillospiraceae bacterium]|nr:DegV family protein [Oscillospiraceae bacterium]
MPNRVIIASDSTCDLNSELLERYQIKILPLGVSLGENQYKDGVDIDPDAIYAHYEKTGELPKTSAVNIAEFQDFFEEQTQAGNSVVLFTISSEMSSTYVNAKLAAEEYENVYVVDSRSLSTGGGLIVCAAGDMAAEGKSAAEIAQCCTALCEKVSASFVVDDLEFLHKGGRCSAVAALGANLLQLKPCIVVKDGKMGVSKKYRGKFSVVLEKYIAEQIGDASDIDLKRIFVTHAGCDSKIIERCVELVKQSAPFGEVQITRAGCTISSHCGRNTLGVLFVRK